jgi:Domain of unknown function (DUF6429)
MEQNEKNKLKNELALALIYLSSWEEKQLNSISRRAWKGYDFHLLDQLEEEGFIDFSVKAKSLYLSDEGIRKAIQLVEKFKRVQGE